MAIVHKRMQASPAQLRITPAVFEHIKETIGMRKAETGGILGGCRQTGEVTHFYFDEEVSEQSSVSYTPNITQLNSVIKTQWKPRGIDFLGSIHSHPPFILHPSAGDGVYAKRILETMELPYLLCPIVTTVPDTGSFSLFPFAAVLNDKGVDFVEQDLVVGREAARFKKQIEPENAEGTLLQLGLLHREVMAAFGFAAMGVAGFVTAGILTAQLLRAMRRHSE